MKDETSDLKLSIVSPVYGAEKIVSELVHRIVESVAKITDDFEIVLVEDGSPDDSWSVIREECNKDPRVKGVRLSRNFGQHFAITAGLEASTGEHMVVMDCDLQDSPEDIEKLYAKALEGFDIVMGAKEERNHAFHRNFFSGAFFAVFNFLSDRQKGASSYGSFSLISRKAVNAFLQYADRHRHYLMILQELGMTTAEVEVSHSNRYEGSSSYTYRKLLSHAVSGITSHSTRLLKIAIGLGVGYFFASIVGVLYLVVMFFVSGFQEGWASLMVLLLGSTGLILIAVGILGVYISNIYDQVRMRPLYLVYERLNFSSDNNSVALERVKNAEPIL
tara:strand:- start:11166 stop:12164 length:999 start_codon:yes stop_codon:yes gene_type:complete